MTSRSLAIPLVLLAVLAPGAAFAVDAPQAETAMRFKLFVAEPGVYRVTFDEIADLTTGLLPVDTSRLLVTQGGSPVPIWIEDGGDGSWGPGDSLEFVGEHLPGETSYYNELADYNVYRLSLDALEAPGSRMRAMPAPPADVEAQDGRGKLWVREHLEIDRLLLRLEGRGDEKPELWYWAKLTHLDPKPFAQKINLRTWDAEAEGPLSLTVSLRGWSHPRRRVAKEMADHRVEVWLNDRLVGEGEWNAQAEYRIVIPQVPREALERGPNWLELRVPERKLGDGENAESLIDVVMLNWIELSYPHDGRIRGPQNELLVEGADSTRPLAVARRGERELRVYGPAGERWGEDGLRVERDGAYQRHVFLPPGEGRVFVVADGRQKPVAAVQVDHPSDLRATDHQADYLMITHPLLRDALQPLVEHHRERGLSVAVVDVHDVYDEFNHGVLHPRAIRDFVRYTHASWREPAPRFVLLVGDASWDTKSQEADDERYADWTYWPGETRRFLKNSSTPYSKESELGHRNLIPTWPFQSHQGHAASDNYFVTLDDGDDKPDLAIGRFPIALPEELGAIVDKTLRYARSAELGPWRSRMLWITNEMRSFQRRTDSMADGAAARGFAGERVYPKPEEADNAEHQEALRRAFDDGQLLVHFYGHGGRYIWRTGPPDYRKNHDLFTLDDLDSLQPTGQLPMVLSMSCYSAPFDHPTADSIGEKFLRLPDKGAVAVLAASWRNSPAFGFSEDLVAGLTRPGTTIGEAVMEAKQKTPSREMVAMYNLLGDPALELAVPSLEVDLEAVDTAGDDVAVTARVARDGFEGQAVVDWLDASWQVIDTQRLAVDAGALDARFQPPPERDVHAVRVYVWNEASRLDGVAALELNPAVDTGEATTAARAPGAAVETGSRP